MWSLCISAVECEAVKVPEKGFVSCTRLDPELMYSLTCEFHCEEGYALSGTSKIQCTAEGQWSQPFPKCEGRPLLFRNNEVVKVAIIIIVIILTTWKALFIHRSEMLCKPG